jgi:hypothetical protein
MPSDRRIWEVTVSGIGIFRILGVALFAVGMAAIRMVSTSAKYFLSRTVKAENRFQKL